MECLAFGMRLNDQEADILDRLLNQFPLWMSLEGITSEKPKAIQVAARALA
jgi:hypothetical protein